MKGTLTMFAIAWAIVLALYFGMLCSTVAAAPAPAVKFKEVARFACPPRIATAAEKAEVKKQIGLMGDDKFATRESAQAKLVEMGEIALSQLDDAEKNSGDLEIRRRAQRAVDKIISNALDEMEVPSIFVLPPQHLDAVYIYFRAAAGEERYFPIDEKLGKFGKWLRQECLVSTGSLLRPRDNSECSRRAAMRKLVDDMRLRIGERRTLRFLRALPAKMGQECNIEEFSKYRYNSGHFQDLDKWAKELPDNLKKGIER